MTDRWISPEEAERLWRRAAELQAETARRLEESNRGEGDPGGQEADDPPPDGYALEHVRQAAVEAGIGEEFLRRALAEMEARGRPDPLGSWDRLADLFLGEGPRELVISRTYEAPAERVYDILQELLPSEVYPLRLVDTRGPHPLEGGVLLFEVPSVNYSELGFSYEVRGWADIKQVLMSVERVGPHRTVVTMRAPLAHSRRVNLWVGGGLSAMIGGVMGGVTGALAAAVAAPVMAATLVVLVGIVVGAGTFTSLTWGLSHLWRPLYRYALDRGRKPLEAILLDVQVRLRPGDRIKPPGSAPPLPPAPPSVRHGPDGPDGPDGRGGSGDRAGAGARPSRISEAPETDG